MFQLFEEQATLAGQWVLFIRSKRDNTIMKPGRKWVQVIKFHHFIVQNYEIPFQVLSSLAAALCQGACGHCVPLSAYMIPQVLHVNTQYWGGMCAIPAGEGKSALFCTEFSEEFGDAPNSVTNSALIFSQCWKKHIFQWLFYHWIRWWFIGD